MRFGLAAADKVSVPSEKKPVYVCMGSKIHGCKYVLCVNCLIEKLSLTESNRRYQTTRNIGKT